MYMYCGQTYPKSIHVIKLQTLSMKYPPKIKQNIEQAGAIT